MVVGSSPAIPARLLDFKSNTRFFDMLESVNFIGGYRRDGMDPPHYGGMAQPVDASVSNTDSCGFESHSLYKLSLAM